ncbi:lipopolysaccharide biosynthesis protein [Mucilaginibacter limnophilus]|uniref:Lipopolysaccharide biosynthesis protein n=1 Tax=Mucilaginibacter limnophilus TaxID=1932778 RepID=A0A3S2UPB8_9SPHI|nr:Wzz/FepE/Etk N-terminal domain-containing protein [Mucilaginibacter limnophilus]RVU02704.1 lipopolysaccharide biosynthesis protein [Mucilaginibacter limnophilus]
MEFGNFIRLLLRHKYILIAVPVLAVIITYFLVRNQPDVYSSQGQIATGIVDQTQQVLNSQDVQESKISQEFSNLIQMMRSKRILDQVSYRLMIHDLTSERPFKKPSKLLNEIGDNARRHALQVYTDMYKKRGTLSLFNPDQNGLNKLLESMGYDDKSLLKTLLIYRAENSDFINVQYDAGNPEEAAFVVNTLCKEFISYYTSIVKENQHRAVTFLGRLLQEKQDSLNSKTRQLQQYKINNRVLSLAEQAKTLYGQLSEYENQREEALKDAVTTGAAINRIDDQFDPRDRQYRESSMTRLNVQITELDQQLKAANDAYIESGFDEAYKEKADSLQRVYARKIQQSSDKYILNPLTTKQNLVQSKTDLQTQNTIAKASVGTIDRELSRLNSRFDQLVPHEAVIGSFEKDIEVAQQEYLALLSKYNQVSMEANFDVQLRQVVTAMPGLAQPSKKMLLVIIGGVVSFVFCVIVLFVIFFLDNTVKTSKELANRTKIPVLGHLNLLNNSVIDFKRIWDTNEGNEKTRQFKNLLRSVRYEIDNELNGEDKVLLVNSLQPGEGKTLLSVSLAYSHAIINQKVLLIDGNFEDSGITDTVKPQLFLEDFLKDKLTVEELNPSTLLNVWGNRGGDISLFEIRSEERVKQKFAELRKHFDIIIIESSALNTLNRSKEWVTVADKVVAVFESGQNITETIKPNINYLKSIRPKFIGWVLNKVEGENATKKRKRT